MVADTTSEYSLLLTFLETYIQSGSNGIASMSQLNLDLDRMMDKNRQYFFIADLINFKIIYTSKLSTVMIGIDPLEVSPNHLFEVTHPDDLKRHSLGREKVIKMAHNFYMKEQGEAFISSNFRIKNPKDGYSEILVQCYLMYSSKRKTVYIIQVHTNIDWCKKKLHGYHYYLGNDLAFFRYPDIEMLKKGNIFSDREFEILNMIAAGLNNDQVAKKLFLSTHTVVTHRRNILKKSGKLTISEVIYDLIDRGLL
jgi:hypothetical protein